MSLDIPALVGLEKIEFKISPNYTDFYKRFNEICLTKDTLRSEIGRKGEAFDGRAMSLYVSAIFNLTKAVSPKLVVELGVREGFSSSAILRALSYCDGQLVSFDPDLAHLKNDLFVPGIKENWTLHGLTGEEGYEKFGDQIVDIDLLYIDTEPHSYEVTKTWLEKYWVNNVKAGGYIMLDDCAPQHQRAVSHANRGGVFDVGVEYGVLEALLDFLEANNKIDFAFSIANSESHGVALIKLKGE